MEQKIQLIVFDWAGTTVDYGSCAPTEVFNQVFISAGIHLTREEINRPMGLEKKAHIRELLSGENGSKQWQQIYGRMWTEEDVENLFQKFEKTLYEVVASYSRPIEGAAKTVQTLKAQGLLIGSTTGYHSKIMERVIPLAAEAGYAPDCVVTPDVTGGIGRPSPFMLFECMRKLNVYPPSHVIKVGDTVADILEGKNAGAWSIGILTASNLLGLTEEEYQSMDPEDLKARKQRAAEIYKNAGADMVIDTIADLVPAVEEINRRLEKEAF